MALAVLPPGEHEVLVFLVQVALLLTVARALGWAFRRVGQPAVIGELLAGVLVGPSVFGRVLPDAFDWTFPSEAVQSGMLYALAWLGLLLLLGTTGIESDLSVIRRLGRPAVVVTAGSLVLPLLGGFLTGLVMPDELVGPEVDIGVFAAFLAVALSISSLPVVARVLAELGMVRRDVGQLILAVAVANDIVGWILLGVVAGLAGSTSASVADVVVTVGAVAAFLAVALSAGQHGVDRLLRATAGPGHTSQVVAVIALVVGAGALTQWIGVEAVLGAFVAGLVVGRSRWRDERAVAVVDTVAHGVLAPLFFATAGLRVDLGVFADATVATWSVVIIVVASATKLVGASAAARAAGLPRPEGLALGAGLNARGALEIVIASIGLGIGVLTDASYGAIVVMAIVTSVAAPPLLRRALRGWPGTPAEQQRLRAEELARQRIVVSNRPPLLLTRGGPASISAAQLLDLCWPPHHPVTVVAPAHADLAPIRHALAGRPVHVVHPRRSGDDAILAEVGRGHAAVVVGLTDRPGEPLLTPLVRRLLGAEVPVVLLRRERISGRPIPAAFGNALVPVTGSHTARAALELATAMSAALGTQLTLANVDNTPPAHTGDVLHRVVQVADPILRSAAEAARSGGASQVTTLCRVADNPVAELNRLTLELEIDIVIAGTTTHHAGDATHLGPVATHLLAICPATVAIVATPPGWTGSRRS